MTDPEPRTVAGKMLLAEYPSKGLRDHILAIEAEAAAAMTAERDALSEDYEALAASSDELRAALTPDEWEYIAQLVDAFAADDPTGLPDKFRAALSSKPSAEPE